MSFLEDKIRNNKAFFDDREPALGHKARFLDKLDQAEASEDRPAKWFVVARFAAVAIIFLAASYLVFRYSIQDLSGAMIKGVTQINLSDDMQNVFNYYDAMASSKVEEIDQLAKNSDEAEYIRKMATRQLENLDANLATIEKEYAKNPGNKKLYAAMVNNKRKKSEILDEIINQLEQASHTVEEKNNMNP